MAYQDPYDAQYGRNQPQYRTTSPEQFNPYANNQPVTQAPYGQAPYADYNAGYRDEPNDEYYQQQQRRPTYDPPTGAPEPQPQYAVAKSEAPSGFESGEFTPREKTAHDLRAYRYESQGRLWTKGSRAGCITRFFCCTLLITIFVFASIVLALALWIRPPSVIIGDIYQPATGSQFQLTDNGVKINFNLNVSVNNPNYFSVDLKRVKTDLFYPINNTDIGGGVTNDIVFESNSNKTVSFPFSIDYTTELDPSNAILLDLLQKCGILGTASDITVDYELTLSIRILLITVSPKISNSFSFTCPLDSSSLSDLMGNSGMDLGDILGGTG